MTARAEDLSNQADLGRRKFIVDGVLLLLTGGLIKALVDISSQSYQLQLVEPSVEE